MQCFVARVFGVIDELIENLDVHHSDDDGDGDVDVDDERLVRLDSHLELALRVNELVPLHHLGHSMIVGQLVVLRKEKMTKNHLHFIGHLQSTYSGTACD